MLSHSILIQSVQEYSHPIHHMPVSLPQIIKRFSENKEHYQKKEIGIKGVIDDIENIETVMQQINLMYKDVTAKYPENFSLELKV